MFSRRTSGAMRPFVAALAVLLFAFQVAASGGTIVRKTDGGPDGYYYNALGTAAGRYGSLYSATDLIPAAILCGTVYSSLDQSAVTPGVDDYSFGCDLRFTDVNSPGYADLTPAGLIAISDANGLVSCTTTGAARTATFGGAAGVANPMTPFLITMSQPANNDPNEGTDFCGILLDTTSVFVNSSRTQGISPAGPKSSIGFNHFVELISFQPADYVVRMRLSGSPRYPGDGGLPIMFARRTCALATDVRCVSDPTDPTAFNRTNDLITARLSIDNNTAAPAALNLIVTAFPAVISPKFLPRNVTAAFRGMGGGPSVMNPIVFPTGRTLFDLEIPVAIKRRFLPAFPVDLPFTATLTGPNTPNAPLSLSAEMLGIRPSAGYYDGDTHIGGFFGSRFPAVTGDALAVRYDAVDLPALGQTTMVTGAQVVGGEFGTSGLTGIDAYQLRREDSVLLGSPDLSPQGIIRTVGSVGDPGNADGISFGLPATTVNIDFTDFIRIPGDNGLARNVFGMAFMNPGDSFSSATAIGSSGARATFIGNSSTLLGLLVPGVPAASDDFEMRLNVDNQLFSGIDRLKKSGEVLTNPLLREAARFIEIDKNRRIHR